MHIIIIGGEASGMSAAAKAKRTNPEAKITVYEATDIISFGACGLPYYIGNDFDNKEYMTSFSVEDFAKKGIEVKISHTVTNINPKTKEIEVFHGEDIFTDKYDKLLIATGAKEAFPPINGLSKLISTEGSNVHSLRILQDGIDIKQAIANPEIKEVSIIGSGFIGLEVVDAMLKQGKKVRLFEAADRLIPSSFDKEITDILETELSSIDNLTIHLEEFVQEIKGETKASEIVSNKGSYKTDLTIISTGVKPNTEFIEELNINMLSNGAIVVDREGKTSISDIYAVGDCATVWHIAKEEQTYIPLATVANKFGRLVGENLAGLNKEFNGVLGTAAVKAIISDMARTGLSEKEAQDKGINYGTSFIQDKNHSNYLPGQSDIYVKLIYDKDSHKILGGQMIGKKDIAQRINVIATAITMGMTTHQLSQLDLVYAPPFARTWDILNIAGSSSSK